MMLIISIGIIYYFFYNKNLAQESLNKNSSVQSATDFFAQGHPDLYHADLEYDPNSKLVIQRFVSTSQGDEPYLSQIKPEFSNENFIYRVEVTTPTGEFLGGGWKSIPKSVLTLENKRLRFFITSKYSKGAFIRLYQADDYLIWTGRMK